VPVYFIVSALLTYISFIKNTLTISVVLAGTATGQPAFKKEISEMRIYIQMTVRRDLACADRFPRERLSSAMFKSQTRRNSALVARLVESCCFCLTLLVVSLGTLPVRVQAGDATWLNGELRPCSAPRRNWTVRNISPQVRNPHKQDHCSGPEQNDPSLRRVVNLSVGCLRFCNQVRSTIGTSRMVNAKR
jgi:hypothetical protein